MGGLLLILNTLVLVLLVSVLEKALNTTCALLIYCSSSPKNPRAVWKTGRPWPFPLQICLLAVDPPVIQLWLSYTEVEPKSRNVQHTRNLFDRAVTLLLHVDQLWYK
jgi:hypothetical protein